MPVIFRDIRRYYCDYCGIFRSKKSLITSHVLTHHKRPFSCSVDGCHASYRRKDHLTRYLLQHACRELHDEGSPSYIVGREKQLVCQELGCGKAFRYPSKLQKHEDSHGELP
ncbi:unnamed protein product [Dovyalis caffra]|uniref:C2H2-type domain-containing protein n=1 Tax=Dovyalis caffra TaxID=77055 RepID=A0AAV1S461_9ROSI|nr:unnamed protein product [Dovyalis caffra]